MRVHPRFPAAGYDLVVIAASAGGVEAVGQLLSELPADFPAPIVLVQHIGPNQKLLPDILQRRTRLLVRWAEDGSRLCAGSVHVAPPAYHLIIGAQGRCRLETSGKIHRLRPSADATFESAARTLGNRTLAVVLTGYGVDAARGARMIRGLGGVVLVQDPQTCHAASMPEATIALHAQHMVLPLTSLAPAISSLVGVRGAAQLFGFRRAAEEPFPRLPVRAARVA